MRVYLVTGSRDLALRATLLVDSAATVGNPRFKGGKFGGIPMSDDTEVVTQGFFSKLMESIKGVLVGALLFLVAFPCLFMNEWSAVNRYQALAEGQSQAVEIESATVDPGNEGRLVHLSDTATTDETLTDVQFGISEQALKLDRSVEMYQWVQHEKKDKKKKTGGKTETTITYSYTKEWKGSVVSSSSFKKKKDPATGAALVNPSQMEFDDADFAAKRVTVGAFDLAPNLVSKIQAWEDREVTDEDLAAAPAEIQTRLKTYDGGYYLGVDPASPIVGDIKVKFKVVKPAVVTVVASQTNSTLETWLTSAGSEIAELRVGTLTKDEMFEAAVSDRALMSWVLRIGGFFAMFIGLTMIFRPFVVIGDIIPFVGNFLAMGSAVFAFFIAAILSLGTIALSWLIARPLIGAVLCSITILLIVGMVGLAFTLGRSRLKAKAEAAPA